MRRSTLAIIVIILIALTVVIAWFAAEYTQYDHPIRVKNGVVIAATATGDMLYSDYAENGATLRKVRPAAITTKIPVGLPNTSSPSGSYTCDMGGFTVTNDTPCNER